MRAEKKFIEGYNLFAENKHKLYRRSAVKFGLTIGCILLIMLAS